MSPSGPMLGVLWRLRYKLSLRDLPEMFAVRGIVFSHGHRQLGAGLGGESWDG